MHLRTNLNKLKVINLGATDFRDPLDYKFIYIILKNSAEQFQFLNAITDVRKDIECV